MRLLTLRAICRVMWLLLALGIIPVPAHAAAACGGDWGAWLQGLKPGCCRRRRVATHDPGGACQRHLRPPTIIARDHAQGVFKQSFEQFSLPQVPPRLARGRNMLIQYGSICFKIEDHRRPGPVDRRHLGTGKPTSAPILGNWRPSARWRALAYDCRRPDKFRAETIAALQILDRGDMAPADMHGAWAG